MRTNGRRGTAQGTVRTPLGLPESAAKGSRIGPRLCRRSYGDHAFAGAATGTTPLQARLRGPRLCRRGYGNGLLRSREANPEPRTTNCKPETRNQKPESSASSASWHLCGQLARFCPVLQFSKSPSLISLYWAGDRRQRLGDRPSGGKVVLFLRNRPHAPVPQELGNFGTGQLYFAVSLRLRNQVSSPCSVSMILP
jgi:hypothetical protein